MNGKTHLKFGIATGVSTAIAFTPCLTIEKQITLASACILGSVLVDIDNKNSMLGRDLRPFSTIIQKIFGHRYLIHSPFFILLFYFSSMFLLNYSSDNIELRNKIILYSIGFCCCLITFWNFVTSKKRNKLKLLVKCCILYYIIPMFILKISLNHLNILLYGLILGMIGHIILDLMTKGGIRLFYPIPFPTKPKDKEENNKYIWKIKKFSLLPMKTGKWYETIVAIFIFLLFLCVLLYFSNKTFNYMNFFNFIKEV